MAEQLRELLLAGDHHAAWKLYQELHEAGQADAAAHHLGGRAALARDDYYSTRLCMERALAAGASGEILGQVRLVLGDAQRRIGDLSGAVATLEAFLAGMWEYPELGPLWESAGLYNLGLAYRQLGRLSEARAAYEAAADGFRREHLQEQLGMVLWNLAWVQCLQGDTEAAREALAESEQVRADEWARWHQLIGWAFVEATEGWQHSTTEMCKRILRAADAPPDVQAHAHWLLGREALQQNDPKMAMAMAEAAIDAANSYPGSNRARNDAADLWRAAKLRLHELESGAAGA